MSQSRLLDEVFGRMPGSMNKLAKASGLSDVALLRARRGDFQLRPDRLRAMAAALRSWGDTCRELAERLEETANANREDIDGET